MTGQLVCPSIVVTGNGEPADLLCTADQLVDRLDAALAGQQWLDAFLLAAGLLQLVEDRLHPDPLQLRRAASYLRPSRSLPARAAGVAATGLAATVALRRAGRSLTSGQRGLADLVDRLAGLVLDPAPAELDAPTIGGLGGDLGGDIIRLPACFRSFDQHPDDAEWFAHAYLDRYRDRHTPLCVVGVRTSGGYLAPLHAAALRAGGVARLEVLSYRPGRPFLRRERDRLRGVARAGGRVLVADDPPGSGASVAATAGAVGRAGFPDDAVVLLVPMFADMDGPPDTLRRWPTVLQPWTEWSVHRRLTAESVGRVLTRMVGPEWTAEARPRPLPVPSGARGHARGRFSVRLVNHATGQCQQRDVLVEGAGLGYLGRHAVAVATPLAEHLPRVYGFDDGLLYRDWLPPAAPPAEEPLTEAIVSYVAARHLALPTRRDPTPRLRGRDPVWEIAAKRLAGMYGPLAPAAQPMLLEPLMRRLLGPVESNVVDGKTDARQWLPDPAAGGRLHKVDFHQRAFGHLELTCYDPVFDLAGAAADPPSPTFERRLREAYLRTTGQSVDGERWLLYRLTQLWRLGWAGDLPPDRVARQSAAAIHDYLAAAYLTDLPPATGPLCAVDLDGVLESDPLGFPASSPAAVLALRALVVHGYQPVLATGRSLPDVRDRCAAFGLAGAVAEYGTVCYDHGTETVTDLRRPAERALLDRIRDALDRHPDVRVDPAHQYALRVRIADGPVPGEVLRGIPPLAGPGVQIIHGQGQTDLTVRGLDKADGLRALAAQMSTTACALAVGDSATDLALLGQAGIARAPRNADAAVRAAGVRRTRRSYQAGFAEACTTLLGHRPGRCPLCAPPALSGRTTALLAVLGLREDGLVGLPTRTVRLAARTIGGWTW